MEPLKWRPFDSAKGSRQKRPPIKKYVLVILEAPEPEIIPIGNTALRSWTPPSVAVGYRKDAAGDCQSPYFVIPGIGGKVIAWCDCLPNDFEWPELARAEWSRQRAEPQED